MSVALVTVLRPPPVAPRAVGFFVVRRQAKRRIAAVMLERTSDLRANQKNRKVSVVAILASFFISCSAAIERIASAGCSARLDGTTNKTGLPDSEVN